MSEKPWKLFPLTLKVLRGPQLPDSLSGCLNRKQAYNHSVLLLGSLHAAAAISRAPPIQFTSHKPLISLLTRRGWASLT